METRQRWSRLGVCLGVIQAIAACWFALIWARQFRTIDDNEPLIRANLGQQQGFIATDGTQVVPFIWQKMASDRGFDEHGMALVWRDKQPAWINRAGNLVIPFRWQSAWDFATFDLALVEHAQGNKLMRGMINRSGDLVIPLCPYHLTNFGDDGLMCVRRDDGTAWIDRTGKAVIFWKGGEGRPFNRFGLAQVERQQRWGWIDRTGKLAIPCEWTGQPTTTAAPPDFAIDTWTSVRKITPSGDGKWGFIDQQGTLKVPCEWDSVVAFGQHNLAVVSKGSQSGLIDRSGNLVVPCQWHTIDQFDQQHLATVSKDKMYGKIDSTGKLVIPLKYEWLGPFDEHGLAIARSNNKFGWINVQGKEVLPIRWDSAQPFDSSGMASVADGSKCGWIDRTGTLKIPSQWEVVYSWGAADTSFGKDGLVQVQQNGTYGMLNRAGQLVTPCMWNEVQVRQNHLHAHRKVHPLFDHPQLGWISKQIGLDHLEAFKGLDEIRTLEGKVVWRSDLHLLRVFRPWIAGVLASSAMLMVWRSRPRRNHVSAKLSS